MKTPTGKNKSRPYGRLGYVVNTLPTFSELGEITLTIEGKTLETGHEVYDYPLRFYEDQIADLGGKTHAGPILPISPAVKLP